MSNETSTSVLSIAPAVLRLLQGPLYSDDAKIWRLLSDNLTSVRAHFGQIGIDLHVNPEEGFAYLTQPGEEEVGVELPRLIKRIPLGYEATLLAVLLREALEEFDLGNADARDLFLSAKDIKTRLLPYLGERYDETRLFRQFERYIHQMIRLGFLKDVPGSESADFDRRIFQVMRIIKAKINNERLEEIKAKIKEYTGSLGRSGSREAE